MNREAESTDALIRGGRLRSSVEAIVMIVERREPAIDVWFGSTGDRKSPHAKRKAAAFSRSHEPCKSRGLRTVLWAAGGEIPPADPAAWNPSCVTELSPGLRPPP